MAPVPAGAKPKKHRQVIGLQRGFGVPWGIPGPEVVVAEGVETMIAACQLTGVPFGIACLAAANMPAMAISDRIKSVTVVPDNDTPGKEAAAALKQELEWCGTHCDIYQWPEDRPRGWDANDEINRDR
jgi:hypothetical protein